MFLDEKTLLISKTNKGSPNLFRIYNITGIPIYHLQRCTWVHKTQKGIVNSINHEDRD